MVAAFAASSVRRIVAIFLTAAVLALALAACAPRARLHDGFDFEAFKRSPTVLGGVANMVEDEEAGLEGPEEINALLEARFMKERRDLSFVRSGVLRERIGERRYVDLLDRYLDGAGVDTSTYAGLAEAMAGDARYLALARIEDVTVTRRRTTQDPDNNPKTDNDDVTKTTYRNVRITFNLFDLEARREIWTANRVGSASDQVTFSENSGGGIRGVIAALKSIFGSIEPDYPPPRAHEAVEAAFDYFADKIPKR